MNVEAQIDDVTDSGCAECGPMHEEVGRLYEEAQEANKGLLRLASTCDTLRSELESAREALRDIWPFVEEDNGGFATPAYQRAIDGVRAALERKEEA